MPQQNNIRMFDEISFKMIYDAQQGITPGYDPQTTEGTFARMVERQTADFLEDYVAGTAVVTPDAEYLLADFIATAKKSEYYGIKNHIQAAEDKYKLAQITKHKDEEKKKAFQETRFKILNNKKEAARLSSKDMVMMAKLLEEEKGYSTAKMKDKLRSYAMEKIDKTLKGEMPQDEEFVKLTELFGSYQQKNQVRTRIDTGQPIARKKEPKKETPKTQKQENKPQPKKEAKDKPIAEKKQENKRTDIPSNIFITPKKDQDQPVPTKKDKSHKKTKTGFFKKMWKTVKRVAVVGALAVAGYLGGKMVHDLSNTSGNDAKQNAKEVVKPNEAKPQAKPELQATSNETNKTADFSQELETLNKAYKNRFDTALKIILGETERNNLYQEIDQLAKDGKIALSDGTTREWYAHAFTMYNELAPNSKEAQAIKNLRNGGTADKEYINSLVLQAGRDGKGIQASGTFSHFDKAAKDLQLKHLKNRKAVKNAEQAIAKAKAAQSR